MDCYISLVDSDSDGERSKEATLIASSGSDDEEYSPRKGRATRSKAAKKGWSLLPRLGRNSKKNAQYSPIVNLDTTSESSNDSINSGSVVALKELQRTKTTVINSTAMKDKTILETVPPSIPVRKSPGDTENVKPSEAAVKHKSPVGSDSDSDDGAPVVKKPSKSRTFRRGLSTQKSNSGIESVVNVQAEESSIYSTRVSNCMNALRKGKLDIPVNLACLADSGSENEEGGFIMEKNKRIPTCDSFDDFTGPVNLDDSSQRSPSREDSMTFANRSPSPPASPKLSFPTNVVNKLSSNVRNAINFLHAPQTSRSYTLVADQDLTLDVDDVPEKTEMTVKVRSRSGIQRFSLKMKETFKDIFVAMAKHEGVKEAQIVMFRREESIRSFDTPQSLSLHVADIIDCRIGDENALNESLSSSFLENLITVYIQGKNSRSKTAIKMSMNEPLQHGLQKYCQLTGVAIETVTLQFDGDVVSCDQTPDDLDIEDGDCIDAITT